MSPVQHGLAAIYLNAKQARFEALEPVRMSKMSAKPVKSAKAQKKGKKPHPFRRNAAAKASAAEVVEEQPGDGAPAEDPSATEELSTGVPQDELAWNKTQLPGVAAAAGGSTDEGFWETLFASEQKRLQGKGKGKNAVSNEEEESPFADEDELADVSTTTNKKKRKRSAMMRATMADEAAASNGGIWLGLEEIDGVDVKYETSKAGKKVTFVPVKEAKGKAGKVTPNKTKELEPAEKPPTKPAKKTKAQKEEKATSEVAVAPADSSKAAETGSVTTADKLSAPAEPEEEPAADATSMEVEEEAEEEEEEGAGSDADELGSINWAALSSASASLNAAPAAPSSSSAKLPEAHLPGWKTIPLHRVLKEGLAVSGFAKPTPIQRATIPVAIAPFSHAKFAGAAGDASEKASTEAPKGKKNKGKEREKERPISKWRDIVGVAQTGSGKTLAYALPILQRILTERGAEPQQEEQLEEGEVKPLAALILTPTRELALQVSKAISALVAACSEGEGSVPFASLATVIGGLSAQKQARQLAFKGGADIIVATPGRLWETIESSDELAQRIRCGTQALVLDEADRMVENGHFAEMEQILRLLKRGQDTARPIPSFAAGEIPRDAYRDMQTFVFSATFSAQLQINLKRQNRHRKRNAAEGTANTLDELMTKVDFRDDEPFVADLSPATRVAETVRECKIECLNKQKDLYLYYFLLRHPGRTLIFLNSIDGIRRLQPILTNLRVPSFPLHSGLQQRQRLKALDHFRSANVSNGSGSGSAVLLATDVAARGLDIPAVDHVIHFQMPRSADTYVHRSGRTGRAGQTGVSLAFIEPAEKKIANGILRSLKRSEEEIPSLPIEYSLVEQLRDRLELASQIDKVEHTEKKQSHDDAWLRNLADEAGLDMLSGDEDEGDADVDREGGKRKKKQAKGKAAALKAELDALLRQPLRVRGISRKYITAGDTNFVGGLLSNQRECRSEERPRGMPALTLKFALHADVENMAGVAQVDLSKTLAKESAASSTSGRANKKQKTAR